MMLPVSKSDITLLVLLSSPFCFAEESVFRDETLSIFGASASWNQQLAPSAEDWLARLDRFAGLDTWGFNGVSVGDVNSDGLDDLYVCQPGGLPNLLFMNKDGKAVEVGSSLRVDLLDRSRAALWVDLDNDSDPDLVVATGSGLAVLENRWPEPFFGRHFWPSLRNVIGFAATDFTGDGHVDLLLIRGQPETFTSEFPPVPDTLPVAVNGPQPILFRGGPGITFDILTDALPPSLGGRFATVAHAVDINGDAKPDLVLGNACGPAVFLMNNSGDSGKMFSPFSESSGMTAGSGARYISYRDFTGDGHPDFCFSGWSDSLIKPTPDQPWLADWNRSRTFLASGNATQAYRKNDNFWPKGSGSVNSWGGVSGDFNLDGRMDVVLAEGGVTWSRPVSESTPYLAENLLRLARESASKSNAAVNYPEEVSRNFVTEVRKGSNWQSLSSPLALYLNRGQVGLELAQLPYLNGDGRSVASLDWNGDARPDLVCLGRGAPQLGLLMNKVSYRPGLSLRLKGSSVSRHSAGAHVNVQLADGSSHHMPVTDGGNFLGQSSSDIMLGVDPVSVTAVTVRWAWSDKAELFKPLSVGSRWLIEEGKGKALPMPLKQAALVEPHARNFLNQPNPDQLYGTGNEPLLPLVVQNVKGELFPINERFDRPTVLVIFGTSDKAALAYLKTLAEDDRRLRLSGARIIALCADPVPGVLKDPMVPAEAAKFISTLNLPFFTGLVDESGWLPLRLAYEAPLVRLRALKPTSVWLLGATGAVHVFYEGMPKTDQLVADVKAHLSSNGNRWKLSLPFAGRWMVPPETVAGPEMAAVLSDRQNPMAAWRHVQAHRDLFGPSIPYARFLAELGVSLKNMGSYRESIDAFREALRIAPNTPSLMNNLAWVLLVAPDPTLREPAEALRLARLCNEAEATPNTVLMDTLAVALAANDLIPEAIDQAVKALESAKRDKDVESIKEISRRLEFFRQGKSWPP